MNKLLFKTKQINILPSYYFFLDFSKVSLGRSSSEAAKLLNAKFITSYSSNKYYKISIFILNSSDILITGNKERDRRWHDYKNASLRTIKLERDKNIEWVIRHSISGMLGKNKLRKLKEAKIKFLNQSDLEQELKKHKNSKDIMSHIYNFLDNKEIIKYAFENVC